MEIRKYGRNWAVYDGDNLICVTLYKCGATSVLSRLSKEGNHFVPPIDLREFTKLQKDFRQLNKKFNRLFKEIKSRNKSNEAV